MSHPSVCEGWFSLLSLTPLIFSPTHLRGTGSHHTDSVQAGALHTAFSCMVQAKEVVLKMLENYLYEFSETLNSHHLPSVIHLSTVGVLGYFVSVLLTSAFAHFLRFALFFAG